LFDVSAGRAKARAAVAAFVAFEQFLSKRAIVLFHLSNMYA
jgi:hypothetical protein